MNEVRAEFARRRAHGLRSRHAAKLRHLQASPGMGAAVRTRRPVREHEHEENSVTTMENDVFDDPGEVTGGVQWGELLGSLLLVNVKATEHGVKTGLGEKDAVRADITVLDGNSKGDEHPDALIFPKVLQVQLRSKVGRKILGRLTQGQAKPGQSAPWTLAPATPADKEIARAHLNGGTQAEPPF